MTNSTEEIIKSAISDARAGNKEAARKTLSNLVRQEPNNARLWYLLSQVVEKKEQAIDCLEMVLKLQPDNIQAEDRLKQLEIAEIQAGSIHMLKSPFEPISTNKSIDTPIVDYPIKECPCCGKMIHSDDKFCDNFGNDFAKGIPRPLAEVRAGLLDEQLNLEKNLTGWERYLQEQSDLVIKMGQTGSRYFWLIVGLILTPVIIGIVIIILAVAELLLMNTRRKNAEANKTIARRNIEIIRNRILEIWIELEASSSSDHQPKIITSKPIIYPEKSSTVISKKPFYKSKSNLILTLVIIILISVFCVSSSIIYNGILNSTDSENPSSVSFNEAKAIRFVQDWKPKNNKGWTCKETFDTLVYFYINNLGISDARVEWSVTKHNEYLYIIKASLKGEKGWVTESWKLSLPDMKIHNLDSMTA